MSPAQMCQVVETLRPESAWQQISPKMIANGLNEVFINSDDPQIIQRILAFLNAEPVAYVVGKEEEIHKIKPESVENEHCLFAESLGEATAVMGDHETIYGLHILPLN